MDSCFSVSHGYQQCLKLSEKEVGSLPQAEVERPLSRILFIYFWSENGEFWCMFGGILCDLKLQKRETRYRPGKSKGAGSLTRATRPHFKPWLSDCLWLSKLGLWVRKFPEISGEIFPEISGKITVLFRNNSAEKRTCQTPSYFRTMSTFWNVFLC